MKDLQEMTASEFTLARRKADIFKLSEKGKLIMALKGFRFKAKKHMIFSQDGKRFQIKQGETVDRWELFAMGLDAENLLANKTNFEPIKIW